MKSKKLIILAVVILAGAVAVIGSKSKLDHGDGAGHEGHDHSATEAYKADVEIDATDDHEGHDHGDDSGHEDHGQQERADESVVPLVVQLSVADAKRFGIEVDSAGAGKFDVHVTVPGEITFNANKLARIVPTVPGIVRQVVKDVGDTVAAGEIIAWIESTEVGGAKLDYLAKHLELSCCAIELVRIQEINDNTLKLLEVLKDSPSLEILLKMNGSAMGMNRSRLVSSYAEFIFAKETHLREKDLYEKKITSKEDFLKAQLEFKKTDAEYTATKDSIAFEIKRDLLEVKRTQQTKELEVQAAERLLYLHGLTAKDVRNLVFMAKNQNFQAKAEEEEDDCADPNCKACVAAAKNKNVTFADNSIINEKIAWYPVRSPFQGTVINKHITLGDVVSNDKAVFVVADLSSVWVDLQVHQKDIDLIRKGQKVTISTKSSVPETKGVIDYVDPVIDRKTRTSLARVVLDNTSRRLRPGTFITAKIMVENRNAKLMVSKDILQDVGDTTCVFVQNSHGFEARPVTVGWSNKNKVEIISGLKAGEKIVTKNSFRLKAELEKEVGGGHAGHAH